MLSNPVLRGFHPDPSMIRVGSKYYIANSTFEWWPGVRFFESSDLESWSQLPSPLDSEDLLMMRGNPSSGGVWAPDLSYADGVFWLVYSDVKIVNGAFKDVKNYVISASDITGPWSEPVMLNGVGFDASLFHDDDGKKYLIQQTWDHREYHHSFKGITLTEFDPVERKLVRETQRIIWEGDDIKLVEGPHIYKVNGFYYLFAAEGGTKYTHHEVVARSNTLDELSFEGSPINPLLTNMDTPHSYLQKQGHGALVDTPSGEWYYASLCSRPWHSKEESSVDPRGWCTLGRETSIQKVDWDSEGWPFILGGRGGKRFVPSPGEPGDPTDELDAELVNKSRDIFYFDDFSSSVLEQGWSTLRVPFSEEMGEISESGLTLAGQGSLSNLFDLSLVARRWQAFNFAADTCVSFNPDTFQAMAGLTNYYNDQHWSWIFITYDDERRQRVLEVAENNGGIYKSYFKDQAPLVPEDVCQVWLRTRVSTQTYTYDYSFDAGVSWIPTGVELDAKILSDDYVSLSYGGFFTGAFVGLACVDYSGYRTTADFGHFSYQEHDCD